MTSLDAVQEKLDDLADVIGTDVTYFQPLDEKHFDPITVALVLGGAMMLRFFDGVKYELMSSAEAGGRAVARHVLRSARDLFTRYAHHTEGAVAGEVKQAADQAMLALDDVLAVADAAEAGLLAELRDAGIPAQRAVATAARVRAEALALLVDPEEKKAG